MKNKTLRLRAVLTIILASATLTAPAQAGERKEFHFSTPEKLEQVLKGPHLVPLISALQAYSFTRGKIVKVKSLHITMLYDLREEIEYESRDERYCGADLYMRIDEQDPFNSETSSNKDIKLYAPFSIQDCSRALAALEVLKTFR